jgi:hypothetical protein
MVTVANSDLVMLPKQSYQREAQDIYSEEEGSFSLPWDVEEKIFDPAVASTHFITTKESN